MPSRRTFADRIARGAYGGVSGGSSSTTVFAVEDFVAMVLALPSAASVAATDVFPGLTTAGDAQRATASQVRTYVLGVSGGVATLAEALTIGGNFLSDTHATDDIGATGTRWKDGWFSGTVTAPDFVGDLTGNADTATFATSAGSAPNELTADELAAINNANAPDGANPFATMADVGGGSGDVVGPVSATDDALARFDGTTGKLLKDSTLTLTDADVLTLAGILRVVSTLSGQHTVSYDASNAFETTVTSGGNVLLTPGAAYYDRNLVLGYRVVVPDETGSYATGAAIAFTLPASSTAVGPFRILQGTAPTAPLDGSMWSTTAGFYGRANSATVGPFTDTGDVRATAFLLMGA